MDAARRKVRITGSDPETFQERWHFTITPMRIVYVVIALLLATSLITYLLIAHTVLRELIIGDSSRETLERAVQAEKKVRQLEYQIGAEHRYWENVRKRLLNEPEDSLVAPDSIMNRSFDADTIQFTRSYEDSVLRSRIEESQAFNGESDDASLRSLYFFAPVEGNVVQRPQPEEGHYGVDVSAPEGAVVHAVLDGTVLSATWTSDGGNEIHIQHDSGLLSIYKHNATLLKKPGERVTAGEPIGIIGNTGRLSSGTHLHFELWHNGSPLNPENYIIFVPYGD